MPKIAPAQVHRKPPLYFQPKVHVSGCFILVKDRFLILERHSNKPQGETWGIPSGKLEKNETAFHALLREVKEEINLQLNSSQVKQAGTLYVEHTDLHFCYHLFYVIFSKTPKIQLNFDEHTNYKWVTLKQAAKLPLIGGGWDALNYFFNLSFALEEAFKQAANPQKAQWYKKYMREQFPFLGVPQPIRKRIQKILFKQHPLLSAQDLKKTVLHLWKLPEREYIYAAIDLLKAYKRLWKEDFLSFFKELILTKSWWDSVDSLAILIIGPFLLQFPHFQNEVEAWSEENNLWLTRTVLLYQLSYKGKTDQKKLFKICLKLGNEQDFFIKKAMGWALRQYRKTNPLSVDDFIKQNHHKLSSLTIKEALGSHTRR